MLVAEADMDGSRQTASTSSSEDSSGSPAGKGDGAFNTLAKFIFGGNAAGTRMRMTTPVFSDNRGSMQFVIEPSYQVWKLNIPNLLPSTDMTDVDHVCIYRRDVDWSARHSLHHASC